MILILTDPAVGGTFLTWSLHYLSGHKNYFHSMSNCWKDLADDPLTNLNAHNFRPNQSNTIEECYSITDHLTNTPTSDFHTLYFHNLSDQTDYTDPVHVPTRDMIKDISGSFSKIVVLTNNHTLYPISYYGRNLSKKFTDPTVKNQSFEEQHFDFIEHFFKDSYKTWTDQNLTDVWDHREFLALNIRPNIQPKIRFNFDQSTEHYQLDTFDFYNTFDINLNQLFNYLDIEIDQKRLAHWKTVYQKWRQLHTKKMQFVWYFDTILDSIINGYDLDLTRFDLDIVQEACIQHHLIYNHNLNLKTWQLDKFINAKQLHQLLEPNLHPLSAL